MRIATVMLLVVALACALLLAASCSKQTQTAPDTEVVSTPPPIEEPEAPAEAEEATQPAGEAEETAATGGDPMEVVEEVGAPVYEGAEADSVEASDGETKAIFLTPDSYKEVKEFYLGELTEPAWTNNGFEAGAMGGDEWEFKNADGTKLVGVRRDSGDDQTRVIFTLKPSAE